MTRSPVSPPFIFRDAPRALADRPGDPRTAESVRVVLLTRTGEIALALERIPGLAPVVRLPGLPGASALDSGEVLRRRLRDEADLDAGELVVMSRYGIPTGERGTAAILLAPGARRRRGRRLAYVPVSRLASWLKARRSEGWRVDLMVRVGLRLAERHFARWGRVRLREVVAHLRGRRGEPRVSAGASPDSASSLARAR